MKFLKMTAANILEPSGLLSSAISLVNDAKNFLYAILSRNFAYRIHVSEALYFNFCLLSDSRV